VKSTPRELQSQEGAPLVRVDSVSKTYREGALETRVLRAANLELARGETTSLTGVSGSGKSTLISLLAGLMLPDAGRVAFDGQDITGLDEAARARLRANRIGVVLQSGNLIPFLTAVENVELAVELAGGDGGAARARALLSELGLERRLDHLPRRMSGGEAQRVSVAMALANEPDLLLADEVTGELDSSNAEQVMGVIFDAWRERGLTVLFVTHSSELAARAQHRLQLAEGEVRSV
jgi:putative ABC transport system ATP-binding protein